MSMGNTLAVNPTASAPLKNLASTRFFNGMIVGWLVLPQVSYLTTKNRSEPVPVNPILPATIEKF
jgi:hypothetical protein